MMISPKLQATLYRLLKSLIFLSIFNTAIAVVVTILINKGESFSETWIFSMLIGWSIKLIIDLLQWLAWRDTIPPRAGLLMMCLIGAPIGYYIGASLGLLITEGKLNSFDLLVSKDNQTSVLMSVFMSVLVSLFAVTFLWSKSKIAQVEAQREKEKARVAEIEKRALQAQLQLLQAQIEPHMLFNTLANLQGLMAIDVARAQHMLEQLIRYLRASLQLSRVQHTSLAHEFGLLEAYLALIAVRLGKRLRYTIDLPDDLAQQTIAPMLLQPLVENAIKHGLEPKVLGGEIHVLARREGELMHLIVRDTGLGLPPDYDPEQVSIDQQSGVGNANIRERLLALYGEQGKLILEKNVPEGVIAHLYIPIIPIIPISTTSEMKKDRK
jgi:sensor histidine kinase YesM